MLLVIITYTRISIFKLKIKLSLITFNYSYCQKIYCDFRKLSAGNIATEKVPMYKSILQTLSRNKLKKNSINFLELRIR